jgi:hypothetical protein
LNNETIVQGSVPGDTVNENGNPAFNPALNSALNMLLEKHLQLGTEAIKVVRKLNQFEDHDAIDFFIYVCADPEKLEALLDGYPDEFEQRLRAAARKWAWDCFRTDQKKETFREPIKVTTRPGGEDGDVTVDTLAKQSYKTWERQNNYCDPLEDDSAPVEITPVKSRKQGNILKLLFELLHGGPMPLRDLRRAVTAAGFGRVALQTALAHPSVQITDKTVALSETGLRMLDLAASEGRKRAKPSQS